MAKELDIPASVWGTSFASSSLDSNAFEQEYESLTKEVEMLKEKVKDMLIIQSTKDHHDLLDNIEFIDLLCRLGVSYHFEIEIDQQLNFIFTLVPSLVEQNDYDLYSTALVFRILRQHGFKMSSDVFRKFKNNEGEFMESLTNDAKGMLSLYEATFLAVRGEDILDKALSFTRKHLNEMLHNSDSITHDLQKKHIKKVLYSSFHETMNRVEAQLYISLYEEDYESRNETLLMLAKLDFNRVQLLYKNELGLLSRWWKDLNFVEKLSNVRDRIVESYFWALGSIFEPQFGLSRMLVAKYTAIVTVIDDTYASASADQLNQLECFTAAIQRGSVDPADQLPESMEVMLKALLDLHNETETSGRNSFVKEAFKKLVRCEFLEKKWLADGYNPSLEEYLCNSSITVSTLIYPAAIFIGMEDLVKEEDYKWLQNNSKVEGIVDLLFRLNDDIQDDEYEEVSCIKCYMKEHGVLREKAVEEIQKIADNAWKDINEEYMKFKNVSRILLNFFLNESRAIIFFYKLGDSFTNPQNMKDNIISMFHQKMLL